VQTHDDDIEKDSQTEEISYRDKWTQHPTGVDLKPFGGRTLFVWWLKSLICHCRVGECQELRVHEACE